jgi:hypothetical protein
MACTFGPWPLGVLRLLQPLLTLTRWSGLTIIGMDGGRGAVLPMRSRCWFGIEIESHARHMRDPRSCFLSSTPSSLSSTGALLQERFVSGWLWYKGVRLENSLVFATPSLRDGLTRHIYYPSSTRIG